MGSSTPLADLADRIRAGAFRPEVVDMAVRLAVDLTNLQIRSLTDEDLSGEMAHCKAQAANLSDYERRLLSQVWAEFLSSATAQIAASVLIAI